jgi:hypothetical protein
MQWCECAGTMCGLSVGSDQTSCFLARASSACSRHTVAAPRQSRAHTHTVLQTQWQRRVRAEHTQWQRHQ